MSPLPTPAENAMPANTMPENTMPEPAPLRWSFRNSYLPAAGLMLAAVASLSLWVGLAKAMQLAVRAIF